MSDERAGRDRRWLLAAIAFALVAVAGFALSWGDTSEPSDSDLASSSPSRSLDDTPAAEVADRAASEDPSVLGSTTTTFVDNDPATLYVSPSGNDGNSGQSPEVPFGTLETAIARTQPGMTLYVMDGTHRITNPGPTQIAFRREGQPDAWTRITAAPGASPVIVATEGTALEPSGSYIEVSGLTIRGETFDANKNYGVGILVADGHHFLIDDNNVSGFATGGIAAVRASHLTFSNNVVYENSKWGPQQGSGLSSWIGTDYGHPDDANGYSDYFVGNVIYRNENLVPSQWIPGGVITDGNGIIIDMNIDSGYSGRTLIANNVIVDNGGRAITVYKSQRVDVVNNSTFANGQTGPTLIGGNSEMNVLDSADVRAWNNLLWNDGSTPALWVGRSSNVEAFNNALVGGTTLGIDIGSNLVLDTNPGVVAPTPSARASDFELTAGSPLIDAGAPVPAVAGSDFFDRPRPTGGSGSVDIGALESGSQPRPPAPEEEPAQDQDAAEQETPAQQEESAQQEDATSEPTAHTLPTNAVEVATTPGAASDDATASTDQSRATVGANDPSDPEAQATESTSEPGLSAGAAQATGQAPASQQPPPATSALGSAEQTVQRPADDQAPPPTVEPDPTLVEPGSPEPDGTDPVAPDSAEPTPSETYSTELASPPVATLAFVETTTPQHSNRLSAPTAGLAVTLGAIAIGLRAFRPQHR